MPTNTSEMRQRLRLVPPWAIPLAALLILAALIFAFTTARDPIAEADASAAPGVVIGTPAGMVISQATATPTASPPPEPTPAATPMPEPPSPTPVATPVPETTPAPAAPPPPPPPPPPTAEPTPEPTAAVVAIAQPDDVVAAFYRHVTDGSFDAAYALWSERMKATYPRAENLEGRFTDTAAITFSALYVAEQGPTTATVQADFTETYDSGSSRSFLGYWQLVLVEGRWLLNAPTY